MNRTFSV